MSKPVFEVAIVGRIAWNLHSLNNEGTVGNVTEPRTVILADGTKTDGISGEMLKHIHAQNVWLLAPDKSVFCPPCRTLRPQRADVNKELAKGLKQAADILDAVLKACALCDLHGFLKTEEAIPRSSTVEFGWAVGLRDSFYRDVHVHARHEVEGRAASQAEREEVSAQMVYHRPTRSGVYAIVTVFAPWRIGLNEIVYRYVNGVKRDERYRLALEAYKAAFARTDGAMTSTRLPHVEEFQGAVVVSTRNFPVPVPSPLRSDYLEALDRLARVSPDLEVHRFAALDELFGILDSLKGREPFELEIAG